MLLRLRTLATGRTGIRPGHRARRWPSCSTPGSPRWCRSTAASAAPATSPRWRTSRLALMGEGEVLGRRRRARRRAAARWPRRASTPVELAEKEGLALINGTDGMLGMLVLACARPAGLLAHADLAAAMSVEALLGTDRVFAADLQDAAPASRPGRRARPTCARCWPARRSSPRTPVPRTPGCRTPTRCAAPPQVAGAARDTLAHAGRRRRARAGRGHRQPGRAARRSGRVQRQLPRRAGRLRAGLPRDRGRRRRLDLRAPDRPDARRSTARTGCRRSSPTTPASTPGT